MTEQCAHDAHVRALLEQVRREAVAKHVWGHVLANPGLLGRKREGRADTVGCRWPARPTRCEQIGGRGSLSVPVLTQPLVERRRQLRLARLVSLAVADADHSPRPVDVGHFEREGLGNAEPEQRHMS